MASLSEPVVLVIDDDVAIRGALVMVLEDYGIRCLEAGNGAQALALLGRQEAPPDLIVLDLMMPVMSGEEFRSAQLADNRLADVPTVVLTAAGDLTDDVRVGHTLRKPVDLAVLLARIRQHIPAMQ